MLLVYHLSYYLCKSVKCIWVSKKQDRELKTWRAQGQNEKNRRNHFWWELDLPCLTTKLEKLFLWYFHIWGKLAYSPKIAVSDQTSRAEGCDPKKKFNSKKSKLYQHLIWTSISFHWHISCFTNCALFPIFSSAHKLDERGFEKANGTYDCNWRTRLCKRPERYEYWEHKNVSVLPSWYSIQGGPASKNITCHTKKKEQNVQIVFELQLAGYVLFREEGGRSASKDLWWLQNGMLGTENREKSYGDVSITAKKRGWGAIQEQKKRTNLVTAVVESAPD